MKRLVFLLLAFSFESFAYQEIEVKFNDANKTDRYFVLDVKKIGSNNDVLYKHINNFVGVSTTYVRVEINCQNKTQRLLGSSGISPEKIDFQAEAEVKKHVPEAYDWHDMNLGPVGQVALSNFICTPPVVEQPVTPPKISEEKRNALQNCLTLQNGEAIAKCLNKK